MKQKQRQHESPDKGEANPEKPLTKAEAKTAMDRFESLTRRLLTVSRSQLQQEQDRHEKGGPHRRKPKGI